MKKETTKSRISSRTVAVFAVITVAVLLSIFFSVMAAGHHWNGNSNSTKTASYSSTQSKKTQKDKAEASQKSTKDSDSLEYNNQLEFNSYEPSWQVCPGCGGSGQIFSPMYDGFGNMIQAYAACPNCGGNGYCYY